jgi:hypothetical protein
MDRDAEFPDVIDVVGWEDRDRAHQILKADRGAWERERAAQP